MKKNTTTWTIILMAALAAQAACGSQPLGQQPAPPMPVDPNLPPVQVDPSLPPLWCQKAPLQLWLVDDNLALIRNQHFQFLVMPRGLDCGAVNQLIPLIPRDCLPNDCGQFERSELPQGLAAVFDGLAGVTPRLYKANPKLIGDNVDPRIWLWTGQQYEVVQSSRAMDLHAVLGPIPQGKAAPISAQNLSSFIQCTPCDCGGANPCTCAGPSDPGERPEANVSPECPHECPGEEENACAELQPGNCECYSECCPAQ